MTEFELKEQKKKCIERMLESFSKPARIALLLAAKEKKEDERRYHEALQNYPKCNSEGVKKER